MNSRYYFRWGVGFAGLSVLMGALSAHILKKYLSPDLMQALYSAIIMQGFHALAIINGASISDKINTKKLRISLNLMIAGTLMFSGSIYLLIIKNLSNLSFLGFAGPITPFGGIMLLVSWIVFFSSKKHADEK